MRTFATITSLAILALATFTCSSSAYSDRATNPLPAVEAFLDKEAKFFLSLSEAHKVNGPSSEEFDAKLALAQHTIESIMRSRWQIIMASVSGWEELTEQELKTRMGNAVDDAFVVANKYLAKLYDLAGRNDSIHGDVKYIVKYLREQYGAKCLLGQ